MRSSGISGMQHRPRDLSPLVAVLVRPHRMPIRGGQPYLMWLQYVSWLLHSLEIAFVTSNYMHSGADPVFSQWGLVDCHLKIISFCAHNEHVGSGWPMTSLARCFMVVCFSLPTQLADACFLNCRFYTGMCAIGESLAVDFELCGCRGWCVSERLCLKHDYTKHVYIYNT